MCPLTQEEIENRSDPQNLRDIWVEAVKADSTDESLEDFVDELTLNMDSDQYYPFDDTSYRKEFNQLWEEEDEETQTKIEEYFGVEGEDYVDWSIYSGGRCFSADDEWDEVLNRGALKIIKEFEGE